MKKETIKTDLSQAVEVHTFNTSTQEPEDLCKFKAILV